jgi:hypothetical protein
MLAAKIPQLAYLEKRTHDIKMLRKSKKVCKRDHRGRRLGPRHESGRPDSYERRFLKKNS